MRQCSMQEYKVQSTTALRNANQLSSLTSLVYSLMLISFAVLRT